MKEKRVKVKEFMVKHKEGFTFAAIAGVTVLGGIVGYKVGRGKYPVNNVSTCNTVKHVLENIDVTATYDVFGGVHNKGFKPEMLGELGEAIIESGCSADQIFTHFIAFGKDVNVTEF